MENTRRQPNRSRAPRQRRGLPFGKLLLVGSLATGIVAASRSDWVKQQLSVQQPDTANPLAGQQQEMSFATTTITAESPPIAPDQVLTNIAGFNGYTVPCQGEPRTVVRKTPSSPSADWSGIPDSGTIGIGTSGEPIHFYIREACDTQDVKTLLVVGSIHGTENGGQFVAHDLLYNASLPNNLRVIAVPELNKWGVDHGLRTNGGGVDLNRNNPNEWDQMSGRDLDASTKFYRGDAPASEPETIALEGLLSVIDRVDLAVYYHDRLGYVAPVGSTPVEVAETYNSVVGLKLGGPNSQTVTVKGAADAWSNQVTGSPTLLVEMTDDQSDPIIQQHVEAAILTASQS